MKQSRTSIIFMLLAVLYCLGLIVVACTTDPQNEQAAPQPTEPGYQKQIFDPSVVHTIDIQVTEEAWRTLKAEALSKECIDSTVTIDGEEICHVGVRPKGNSTLVFSAAKGWDRYSLALEFDAFNKGQRYYGLDQLSLYNNMLDPTYMKTYLSYEMMRSMGVAAPLCSFAAVYLNGEYLGLYAASEVFSESFALRNFGYDYGNIYKPEQYDIAAMLTGELQNAKINLDSLTGGSAGSSFTIDQSLTVSNDVVRLAYQGDSLSAYEDIWRNACFSIGTSDKQRLVNALRQIDQGDTSAVDLDALARYFAVNTFVLNTDCYTTSMAHNYGLYEKAGVLSMLPWDYDVALGNMGSEFGVADPTAFINLPIDTPVMNTTVEQRPMLNVLLSDPEGLQLYHQYLDQLLSAWIENGYLNAQVNSLAAMIRPWVEQDSTTVYSIESHQQAVRSILSFADYRSQSIRAQLDGSIPATAQGQAAAPSARVDCSDYTVPKSGILTVLLPESDTDEISLDTVLQILSTAAPNLYTTVNPIALLNMLDLKQLLSLDLSSLQPGEHTDMVLAAVRPYISTILKILLTWIAAPIALIISLLLVRRRVKKKGGFSRVI